MRTRAMPHPRVWAAAAAFGLLLPLLSASPAAAAAARAWDFNGDGRRDLAIGIAGENGTSGAVVAIPATRKGLSTSNSRSFTQNSKGVPGTSEAFDRFGNALASGDFDRDGYADLAIGVKGEDIGEDLDTGWVVVLYGSSRGLTSAGAHGIRPPDTAFGNPDPEEGEFGYELAAGDFDDDGDADLIVATATGDGGILLYRGRSRGLARSPAQAIGHGHGLSGLTGFVVSDLAVGDLNRDGVSDLAIGLMENDQARGAVVVLYGDAGSGLNLTGSGAPKPQTWTEDSAGVKGQAEALDAFGSSVGIGDVTGDGRKDLIVGVVQQPTADPEAKGAIHVLRGSSSGVTAYGDQYLTYDELVADPVGELGIEMAVGDVNRDGIADVAVAHGGAEGDRWGSVMVLHGAAGGLGSSTPQVFTQATSGIGGVKTTVDYWGTDLAIRDVGKSTTADLIVTDPFESVSGADQAGLVSVLWGRSAGLTGSRSRRITQDSTGIAGVPEAGDWFGSAI